MQLQSIKLYGKKGIGYPLEMPKGKMNPFQKHVAYQFETGKHECYGFTIGGKIISSGQMPFVEIVGRTNLKLESFIQQPLIIKFQCFTIPINQGPSQEWDKYRGIWKAPLRKVAVLRVGLFKVEALYFFSKEAIYVLRY